VGGELRVLGQAQDSKSQMDRQSVYDQPMAR